MFTVDDQSFATQVNQSNGFSGQFQIDLLGGTCNVTVNVNGILSGNQASGTASGSDNCLLSTLNFSASFTAASTTTPGFLVNNKVLARKVSPFCAAKRIQPILSILLED